MISKQIIEEINLEVHFKQKIQPVLEHASWIIRITQHKDKPIPVLVVKERAIPNESVGVETNAPVKPILKERGLMYGSALRRCLPVIRLVLSQVNDQAGIPLELHRYFTGNRIEFRGNLPLSEEAGAKLSLLFKLQERVKDIDRVELMAWRIERFSREEAIYWLTRATMYGQAVNQWAQSGMRIMLGGHPGDKTVTDMLDKLRK